MKEKKELAQALVKALGEIPEIPKNRTAKILTKSGSKIEYNYADLADILSAVRPVMAKNGLAIIQTVIDQADSGGMAVRELETKAIHSSGESETLSLVEIPRQFESIQKFGAALSYLRRYTLCSALGIQPDDDVDGELEEQTAPRPQAPQAQRPNQTVRPAPQAAPVQQNRAPQPQGPQAQAPSPSPGDIARRAQERERAAASQKHQAQLGRVQPEPQPDQTNFGDWPHGYEPGSEG